MEIHELEDVLTQRFQITIYYFAVHHQKCDVAQPVSHEFNTTGQPYIVLVAKDNQLAISMSQRSLEVPNDATRTALPDHADTSTIRLEDLRRIVSRAVVRHDQLIIN